MITVGIDEVGRGCWAGPLVAGAVLLNAKIDNLCDSKKLSKAKREAFNEQICASGAIIGLGWVFPEEIDRIGLTASVGLAMQRALDEVIALTNSFDEIIIDGNFNFLPEDSRSKTLIKADDIVPEVSAASIVAKVARDNWMATEAELQYPGYEFASHVGYGTKRHIDLLNELGVSTLHRKSYKPIKALIQ